MSNSDIRSDKCGAQTDITVHKKAVWTHLNAISYFPWFFNLRVNFASSKTLMVPKSRQPSTTETRVYGISFLIIMTAAQSLSGEHCHLIARGSWTKSLCLNRICLNTVLVFTWCDIQSYIIGFCSDLYVFCVHDAKNLFYIRNLKQSTHDMLYSTYLQSECEIPIVVWSTQFPFPFYH